MRADLSCSELSSCLAKELEMVRINGFLTFLAGRLCV